MTIARLEKELRNTKELHNSERDYLQKQYDDLLQKVTLILHEFYQVNILSLLIIITFGCQSNVHVFISQ